MNALHEHMTARHIQDVTTRQAVLAVNALTGIPPTIEDVKVGSMHFVETTKIGANK
jgi:hypothetical protein